MCFHPGSVYGCWRGEERDIGSAGRVLGKGQRWGEESWDPCLLSMGLRRAGGRGGAGSGEEQGGEDRQPQCWDTAVS